MVKVIGKRIYLRDYEKHDLSFFHSWISDNEIMKFLDWKTSTLEESKSVFFQNIEEAKLETRKNYYLPVFIKNEEIPIGNVGISIGDGLTEGEMGWFLKKEFWGRGYATEAAKLLFDYAIAELGLRRICAECIVENQNSEKIMIKLNMKRTGRIRVFSKALRRDVEKVRYCYIRY